MADPFLGEIRINSFSFAPNGWAYCDGQTLTISQNTALYSLISTKYGGDAKTNFMLPDLRGRIPVHTNMTGSDLGFKGGTETTTLTPANMPAHSHLVNAINAAGDKPLPSSGPPTNPGTLYSLAQPNVGNAYAPPGSGPVQLNAQCTPASGAAAPFTNLQPYLALNFCIALTGLYPPRPW